MRRITLAAIATVALAGSGTFALAQTQPQHPPGQTTPQHGGMMHGPGAGTPASRGYMAAMERMSRDMNMPMSGNADRDFAAMMIPHHQSAIDMARVALEQARDPEVRTLAEAVIREQEREIVQLRGILQRLPAR
jgi:uncharacterized protein (DUF305 family)